ncbi:MAG: hypothetical protein QXP31_00175 [Pyrobaculum sp.]
MEELKELLRRLAKEEKQFLREVIVEAFKGDGRELAQIILSSEEARIALAKAIAGEVAIPLNVATKDDVKKLAAEVEEVKNKVKEIENNMATKQDIEELRKVMATKEELKKLEEKMATKEDLEELKKRVDKIEAAMATREDVEKLEKRLEKVENTMATKEQLERVMISLEEEARDVVRWFLRQRGVVCKPERLWLDSDYEFDVYCAAGGVVVVGEAKVRAGPNTVERLAARVEEAARRWPHKFPGRVVKVLYCNLAMPGSVEKAKELGVWLIENLKERTAPPL